MVEIKASNGNILKLEYKYQGVYDHEALYKGVIDWFKDHGFLFIEKVHKFKPPELELVFEGTRKDTGYKKTVVNFNFHAWYWQSVKVKKGDKEKEMIDARYQIILTTNIVYDYEKKYTGKFLESLQKIMHNFILFYKFNIIDWDKAYYELVELHTKVKNLAKSSIEKGAY